MSLSCTRPRRCLVCRAQGVLLPDHRRCHHLSGPLPQSGSPTRGSEAAAPQGRQMGHNVRQALCRRQNVPEGRVSQSETTNEGLTTSGMETSLQPLFLSFVFLLPPELLNCKEGKAGKTALCSQLYLLYLLYLLSARSCSCTCCPPVFT